MKRSAARIHFLPSIGAPDAARAARALQPLIADAIRSRETCDSSGDVSVNEAIVVDQYKTSRRKRP